eukprot:14646493-Heterocapsa_arctica.AAC.1
MADCWLRTAHHHCMRLLHRFPITNQCPFCEIVCSCIQQVCVHLRHLQNMSNCLLTYTTPYRVQ